VIRGAGLLCNGQFTGSSWHQRPGWSLYGPILHHSDTSSLQHHVDQRKSDMFWTCWWKDAWRLWTWPRLDEVLYDTIAGVPYE
jgi:hypothetical protein